MQKKYNMVVMHYLRHSPSQTCKERDNFTEAQANRNKGDLFVTWEFSLKTNASLYEETSNISIFREY